MWCIYHVMVTTGLMRLKKVLYYYYWCVLCSALCYYSLLYVMV